MLCFSLCSLVMVYIQYIYFICRSFQSFYSAILCENCSLLKSVLVKGKKSVMHIAAHISPVQAFTVGQYKKSFVLVHNENPCLNTYLGRILCTFTDLYLSLIFEQTLSKKCEPRSDCSKRSSLIWVHTVHRSITTFYSSHTIFK